MGKGLDGCNASLPSPSSLTFSAGSSPRDEHKKRVDVKTLKKEKTKSKVWGIFGGGKRIKEKEKQVESPQPKSRPAFEIRPAEGKNLLHKRYMLMTSVYHSWSAEAHRYGYHRILSGSRRFTN